MAIFEKEIQTNLSSIRQLISSGKYRFLEQIEKEFRGILAGYPYPVHVESWFTNNEKNGILTTKAVLIVAADHPSNCQPQDLLRWENISRNDDEFIYPGKTFTRENGLIDCEKLKFRRTPIQVGDRYFHDYWMIA